MLGSCAAVMKQAIGIWHRRDSDGARTMTSGSHATLKSRMRCDLNAPIGRDAPSTRCGASGQQAAPATLAGARVWRTRSMLPVGVSGRWASGWPTVLYPRSAKFRCGGRWSRWLGALADLSSNVLGPANCTGCLTSAKSLRSWTLPTLGSLGGTAHRSRSASTSINGPLKLPSRQCFTGTPVQPWASQASCTTCGA